MAQPQVYFDLGFAYHVYSLIGVEIITPGVTVQTIEGVVRFILKDTTTVSDICDDRIYWLKTPQKPELPYVVFGSGSDPHDALYMSLDGSKAKTGQRRFQFTCVSDDSLESLELQHQVMNTLRWAQGTTYGFTIEVITMADMRHDISPETDLYENQVEVNVEYYEA